MKNKSIDLHNHLFAELERLGDESLVGEKLAEEISRADALCKVSGQIIANWNLIIKAYETVDGSMGKLNLPIMLDGVVDVMNDRNSRNVSPIRKVGSYGEHLSKRKASDA